jgi:aminoglycoside phosphotransferase (APT) family kinase protein
VSDLNQDQLERLAALLADVLPGSGPVLLHAPRRIFGGASRQTFAIDAVRSQLLNPLILRLDPPASLINTERRIEFAAIQSVQNTGLPVPPALLLEEGHETLGAAFFVMGRIDGSVAGNPFDPHSYGDHAASIARQCFSYLGHLASLSPEKSPLAAVVGSSDPAQCWHRELDHWAGIITTDAPEPMLVAQAAIRWLRRNPPPAPPRLSIVHGDYRSGNFLHDGAGAITAILDWEMAHVGDPLEDLAWALDPMWAHDNPLVLGGITREEVISVWQEASGLDVDPQRLTWWSVFAGLKGLAIWTSAGNAFAAGTNTDLVNAWSAWYCSQFHERQLAAWLVSTRQQEAKP